MSKETEVGKEKATLNFWDQKGDGAGTTASFYNRANCMVVVFAVDDEDSINTVRNMMSYAERYVGDGTYIKVVVANKTDAERKITREQGEEQAKELNAKYYEISAKTGDGVNEMLQDAVQATYEAVKPDAKADGKKDKKGGKKGKCAML